MSINSSASKDFFINSIFTYFFVIVFFLNWGVVLCL